MQRELNMFAGLVENFVHSAAGQGATRATRAPGTASKLTWLLGEGAQGFLQLMDRNVLKAQLNPLAVHLVLPAPVSVINMPDRDNVKIQRNQATVKAALASWLSSRLTDYTEAEILDLLRFVRWELVQAPNSSVWMMHTTVMAGPCPYLYMECPAGPIGQSRATASNTPGGLLVSAIAMAEGVNAYKVKMLGVYIYIDQRQEWKKTCLGEGSVMVIACSKYVKYHWSSSRECRPVGCYSGKDDRKSIAWHLGAPGFAQAGKGWRMFDDMEAVNNHVEIRRIGGEDVAVSPWLSFAHDSKCHEATSCRESAVAGRPLPAGLITFDQMQVTGLTPAQMRKGQLNDLEGSSEKGWLAEFCTQTQEFKMAARYRGAADLALREMPEHLAVLRAIASQGPIPKTFRPQLSTEATESDWYAALPLEYEVRGDSHLDRKLGLTGPEVKSAVANIGTELWQASGTIITLKRDALLYLLAGLSFVMDKHTAVIAGQASTSARLQAVAAVEQMCGSRTECTSKALAASAISLRPVLATPAFLLQGVHASAVAIAKPPGQGGMSMLTPFLKDFKCRMSRITTSAEGCDAKDGIVQLLAGITDTSNADICVASAKLAVDTLTLALDELQHALAMPGDQPPCLDAFLRGGISRIGDLTKRFSRDQATPLTFAASLMGNVEVAFANLQRSLNDATSFEDVAQAAHRFSYRQGFMTGDLKDQCHRSGGYFRCGINWVTEYAMDPAELEENDELHAFTRCVRVCVLLAVCRLNVRYIMRVAVRSIAGLIDKLSISADRISAEEGIVLGRLQRQGTSPAIGANFRKLVTCTANVYFIQRNGSPHWTSKQVYGSDGKDFLRGVHLRTKRKLGGCAAAAFPQPYRSAVSKLCDQIRFQSIVFESGAPTKLLDITEAELNAAIDANSNAMTGLLWRLFPVITLCKQSGVCYK
jgi:hypothetical protein